MQPTQRSIIALATAISVLTISAVAFAEAPTQPTPGIEGTAECKEGVACDDVIVGGTSAPGSVGGGTAGSPPGDAGATGDPGATVEPICGEEIVEGDGPDGTVSYTPCDDTIEPEPTEPVITEPTPGMANVYARPFDSATVGADDRTVTIDFVSGIDPCYVLDHVDVAYDPKTVTITLFEGSDPSAGDVACIEIGVFKRTQITLDEPLAGRLIVDGAAS